MTTQNNSAKPATEAKAAATKAAKPVTTKAAAKPRAAVKKAVAKAPAKPTSKAVKTPTPKAKPVQTSNVVAPKKAVVAAQPVKVEKPAKVKKPKLVRDSFTIPKDEYDVIDALKVRGGKLGQAVKKSELLRAGIKALAAMSDIQFKAALIKVPTIKTGRPTNAK
jgi:uncharacterized membrane protein